ncbi:MAG: class I SAM-dependent methyltransferase [Leeuwenhoekiella sp.]
MEYPADLWNEHYSKEEFRYGKEPNLFFKEQLDKLITGNILLPAEGEGRNAVYAASAGWKVMAFDISEKGREKAIRLSKENNVSINYKVIGVLDFQSDEHFDAIGLCYAHLPIKIRNKAFNRLIQFLKPQGTVIFEAFAKAQLGKLSGGPKNETMLFSIEDIKNEFQQLDFIYLREETVELSEGKYHQGEAEVIRFLGTKR